MKGHLVYPKHFAALAVAGAALLGTSHWFRSHGAVVAVAVYGAVHSSVAAMTLRHRYALRRKVLFVGTAVILSALSFYLGRYGGRWLGLSAPIEYLVICASAGAGTYAMLIRRLFIADLSVRAILLISLASVLAVLAVYLSGLYARNLAALPVAWWFAFSAGLRIHDVKVFPAGIH